MLALLLIVVLILFLGWVIICYVLVKFIIGIIGRLTVSKWVTSKVTAIVISIVISLLPFFYLLFSIGAKNDTTAYIQPCGANFRITVKGKRMLMAHDPVSALLNHTYDDSASFIILRQNGIISGDELKFLDDNYKFTGAIAIDGRKMKIQLFYDRLHKEPCEWNGRYYLKYRYENL